MNYTHPSEIMDEIARLTPTFTASAYEQASTSSAASSGRATTSAPDGTPTMHVDEFVRGKGTFIITEVRADDREGQRANIR